MDQETPYWFKLIRNWVFNRRGNGLTFPYLLGAQTIIEENSKLNVADARLLLDEIFNSPVKNETIEVFFCPNVQTYVFGLSPSGMRKFGQFFTSQITNEISVVFRNKEIGYGKSEIIETLISQLSGAIESGNFSNDRGHWKPFSKTDIDSIKRVLNIT